jgi:hypothetical protein
MMATPGHSTASAAAFPNWSAVVIVSLQETVLTYIICITGNT